VPKTLVIDRYFLTEKKAIEKLEAEKKPLPRNLSNWKKNTAVKKAILPITTK
jgi:hypothetical protein